jgi:hydrogenase 3 maturation protease
MADLLEMLKERFETSKSIVILGVGSTMKSDDAAGVLIAQKMKEKFSELQYPKLRIYEGESAPENFTGEIKKFKPDHLLVVDAADLREAPGSITFIKMDVINGISFSTHMLPLKIMLDYLKKEVGCGITVLGIQPESLEYDGKMSEVVLEAVDDVVYALTKILE